MPDDERGARSSSSEPGGMRMGAIRHIGVLTSGGDAPGMNAATRAVVRTAIAGGVKVTGILRGYAGLLARDFEELKARSVSNIIQLGGTVLKTSRCPEFFEPGARAEAASNLAACEIDALIAIGGDGTFQGLHLLATEHSFPVVGVPGTIDNDIYGTDFTLGFDTAVNTALESIDKIRDTAASHDRIFFIEVMGRTSGAIALQVGLAGGAEAILVPEVPTDLEHLCAIIEQGRERGKTSFIIVVAEGDDAGGAVTVGEDVRSRTGLDYRVSILGHVQRGGPPTAADRALGSRMGRAAVDAVVSGKTDVMTGVVCGKRQLVPLPETWEKKKAVDLELLEIAEITAS